MKLTGLHLRLRKLERGKHSVFTTCRRQPWQHISISATDSPHLQIIPAALIDNPAATLILAAIVGIGAFTLFAAPGWIERGVFRPYWLVRRREYGTLVTNAFLHADVAHLAFNAISFWAFGFALERSMGTGAFLQLFVFGLLVSDLTTWLRHRRAPGYGTLGASGAITAVLFASIVYTPSQSIFIMPIPVPIPAPVFAVCYVGFSVYAARRRLGGVNHDAHLGGALAGVVFVALHDPARFGSALQRLTVHL